MSPLAIGVGFIIIFLVALYTLRMPIGILLIGVGFLGIWVLGNFSAAFRALGSYSYSTLVTYLWCVVPLYIGMGYLAAQSGLAESFYRAVNKWVGHVRGGLADSVIIGGGGFGAISGDVIGAAAVFTAISLPEMRKYKYNDSLILGCIAAGCNLAFVIPPSAGLIVYGGITTVSIGKLFIAGILPGLLLIALFLTINHITVKLNPQVGPAGPRTAWGERIRAIPWALPIVFVFLLIIVGLYRGVFTPIEGGGFGLFAIFVVGLATRKLSWQGFKTAMRETILVSCMVLLLVIGAMIFNVMIGLSGLTEFLANFISQLAVSPVVVLAVLAVFYFFLGTFMDALGMMIITLPIVYPVVLQAGIDPVHFGIIMVMVMIAGHITPPYGMVIFAMHSVAQDVRPNAIFRGVLPYLIAVFVATAILIAFPKISLLLPGFMVH